MIGVTKFEGRLSRTNVVLRVVCAAHDCFVHDTIGLACSTQRAVGLVTAVARLFWRGGVQLSLVVSLDDGRDVREAAVANLD